MMGVRCFHDLGDASIRWQSPCLLDPMRRHLTSYALEDASQGKLEMIS
jgi:hypothetical protein